MLRRVLIMLSLCSAVLCAVVAYLSQRAIEETSKVMAETVTIACRELLEETPAQSAGLNLQEFFIGKHVAGIDADGDGKWEVVALPLFPNIHQSFNMGYRGVILCLTNVPDQAALEDILKSRSVDVSFWPGRQNLGVSVHSSLAQQYRHLDIDRSPVVFYGIEKANPVLGKTSLRISIVVGGFSVLVGVIALVIGFLGSLVSRRRFRAEVKEQRSRRPATVEHEPNTTVFDRVAARKSSAAS